MSVAESDVVDGIAIGHDGKTLIMLITDHLDFDHITILQEKINTYIWFIESKQYADVYPNNEFSKFRIEVNFLHELSDNCNKFIDVANKQLSAGNIEIVPEVSKSTLGGG